MKTYISVFFLFFLSLTSSCHKDLGPDIPASYVPESLKQMLPYKNGQVIRFISSSGHLIEASISIQSTIVEKHNCQSCPVYEREEIISYTFSAGTRTFVQVTVDTRPFLFIRIFSPADNYVSFRDFTFDIMPGVSQAVCNLPRQSCVSSVTLNGTTYTNVSVRLTDGGLAANDIIKAYHTTAKGLVGFEYGNGNIYSLKE